MLTGKVVLVTGSTSGIGLGIARVMAASGCNVVLNGFGDANEIEQTRLAIEKEFSVKALYHNADVSKSDQIADMIKMAEDKLGSLDVLVNNAGIQFVSSVEDFPEAKWDAIMAINLSSVFHAVKSALPGMKKRGFGRIINISSAHGLVGSCHKAAYVAAKHGVVGLSKVVALENAENGITCNCICPGWVKTPLVDKQIEAIAKEKNLSLADAGQELLLEKQPALRFVTVEEIGEAVKFLSGEGAKTMTGTTMSIDGGWTAR